MIKNLKIGVQRSSVVPVIYLAARFGGRQQSEAGKRSIVIVKMHQVVSFENI